MHVHQAHAALRVRSHRRRSAWLPQGPNVVDDVGPQVQHRAHDLGLVGVYRDRDTQGDRLTHQRHHTGQLLVQGYSGAARPGGLATDVQDIGPLLQQLLAMPQRSRRGAITPPVGERVGRHIDDTHDLGIGQINGEARGLPDHVPIDPMQIFERDAKPKNS